MIILLQALGKLADEVGNQLESGHGGEGLVDVGLGEKFAEVLWVLQYFRRNFIYVMISIH